ncbi:MAG: prepilin-type N-terminal cleavage/methylation domain-containing protein [Elusimicrobia bacterium]|nr:prepilin-type N-terminal cleavage/methylation domain-containing protein [Elusimicrobiota bacterium]
MKKIKKRKGFSLIEVIITITIIAVLSMISGPIYKSYSDKATMAEGYALLGTIRSAQEAYFNDTGYFLHGSYSSGKGGATCNEEVLGIDARHNKYYTSFNVAIDKSPWFNNNTTHHGCISGFYATVDGPVVLKMLYLTTSGVTMFN